MRAGRRAPPAISSTAMPPPANRLSIARRAIRRPRATTISPTTSVRAAAPTTISTTNASTPVSRDRSPARRTRRARCSPACPTPRHARNSASAPARRPARPPSTSARAASRLVTCTASTAAVAGRATKAAANARTRARRGRRAAARTRREGLPPRQRQHRCLNTCRHGVPACTQDPTRTLFAGYPCFWDGSCRGCGPNNEGQAECFNTCQAPQ